MVAEPLLLRSLSVDMTAEICFVKMRSFAFENLTEKSPKI